MGVCVSTRAPLLHWPHFKGDSPVRLSVLLPHAVLLFAFVPCAGMAQDAASTTTPPTLDAATHDAVVRLGGQLMLAGKAYDYDRMLSDELGPRLTGSENYMKAADWAAGEFKRLGLANVHEDP